MGKSAMKFMVRAWNKELKNPEWQMGNKKHRKDCARNLAAITVAGVESWHEVVGSQYSADEAVAEDVSNWN